MAQAVKAGRRQRSRHQGAVGRTDLGDAGGMKERLPGLDLEFPPQRVGAPQQRDVGRVLEIAQANDPGAAVRGAAVVAGRVAIEPEHALAAPRQCMDGRAPHDAETADDDIEMGHSLKSVSLTISCFIAGQAAGADQPP